TEVIHEQFNAGVWGAFVDGASGLGIQPRGTVFQVITSYTGHGHVVQVQLIDGLRDTIGLISIIFFRFTGSDVTESTTTGTYSSTNEEGCFAVFPAFINIGTVGFSAHRVQRRRSNLL